MGLGGLARYVSEQVEDQTNNGATFFAFLKLVDLGPQPIIVDLDNIIFKLGNGSLKQSWRAPSDAAVLQILFKQDAEYTRNQLKRLCKQLHYGGRRVIFVSKYVLSVI
jgi:hypothetical protein